ncbi:hypothetical protein PGS49_22725 [Yersinia intermedia]|uniref:hypothetical protein n=1 Tax=Yersinia intermedia TaxID=631 RepID=UPI0022FDFF9D|nr:hypothetical protein [Yersinia intermedia]MDA5483412.1 hypothetical protein [Yersinia intermedia]
MRSGQVLADNFQRHCAAWEIVVQRGSQLSPDQFDAIVPPDHDWVRVQLGHKTGVAIRVARDLVQVLLSVQELVWCIRLAHSDAVGHVRCHVRHQNLLVACRRRQTTLDLPSVVA